MSRTRKVVKKSQSLVLRNVFYKLWQQDNEKFDEFDMYYESKMVKLIQHFKKKIKNTPV